MVLTGVASTLIANGVDPVLAGGAQCIVILSMVFFILYIWKGVPT